MTYLNPSAVVIPKSASATLTLTELGALIKATGAITLTMPPATSGQLVVKNANSGTEVVTLSATGGAKFEGANGSSTMTLGPGEAVFVFADGTHWWIA